LGLLEYAHNMSGAGAAAGLFPVLLPSVGSDGQDLTIARALASAHTLCIGPVCWSIGILLAILYFSIVYWLFRVRSSTRKKATATGIDMAKLSLHKGGRDDLAHLRKRGSPRGFARSFYRESYPVQMFQQMIQNLRF
jgi:hypothetical protein